MRRACFRSQSHARPRGSGEFPIPSPTGIEFAAWPITWATPRRSPSAVPTSSTTSNARPLIPSRRPFKRASPWAKTSPATDTSKYSGLRGRRSNPHCWHNSPRCKKNAVDQEYRCGFGALGFRAQPPRRRHFPSAECLSGGTHLGPLGWPRQDGTSPRISRGATPWSSGRGPARVPEPDDVLPSAVHDVVEGEAQWLGQCAQLGDAQPVGVGERLVEDQRTARLQHAGQGL